jgi:outer membrane receptor protein involved in Fe transport
METRTYGMTFAVIACTLSFLANTLSAQTSAALTGVVTAEGRELPGAAVTISSPALQGTRTTVTGESGAYSFPALPPGDYSITIEFSGMGTRVINAKLPLSQVTRGDATMKVYAEAITVTAAAPSVIESPQVSTNMTLPFIERLPVQRNQLATAQFAPGVSGNTLANGELSIAGGPGYDNLVLVNGVVVTENTRGQMRPMYVEDAIQETTVLTGAISAQYGRFSGGVVNTITKSGGNELAGSLRDSLSNPSWVAQSPALETREKNLNHVGEGTLGGFVVRDRLWFFGAGRWAKNDTARQTLSIPALTTNPLSPASPAISYAEGNDQKRYEFKLTSQIGARQTLAASWFGVNTNGSNARFSNNIYDVASLTERVDPESLVAAHYNGMVSTSLLLEGHYSARKFSDRTGAPTTDLIAGTVLLDRANNNTRFHSPALCDVCDAERRNNDDLLLEVHDFFDAKSFGSHDLVAGVDRFAERRYANNHQSGSDFSIFVTRAQWNNGVIYPVITPTNASGGGTFIRWNPILVPASQNDLRTDSAFINDSWSAGSHFTFTLGARWDRNHAVDADGVVSSDDSKLSPRLAAQFDLRGDGRQRFSVSFADYASRIADSIASSNQASGNAAAIDFAYRGPAINSTALTVPMDEAIRRIFDYFNSQQGGTGNRAAVNLRANGSRSIPGYAAYFDGTLASPSVREITAGYGLEIGRTGFARVDYIHRDWRDFYAANVTTATQKVNTPLGIPVDLMLIRNSDNLERRYRGVLMQGRWTPGKFDFGAHYTWSKLRGNDDGESGTTGAVANTDPSLFYPEYFNYSRVAPIGYLQGDQRHRLRAWGGYRLPLGKGVLEGTLMQSYDSGLPYSIAGAINLTRYAGAPANLGYASVPNGLYYFSGRGELRTESIRSTDLALRYSVRITALEVFAQADLLNAFNNAAIFDPQRLGTTVSTAATSTALLPFDPAKQTPVQCPQGASAATCTAMGANYQLATNFGQPLNNLAYQTSRTVRVSLGFRF